MFPSKKNKIKKPKTRVLNSDKRYIFSIPLQLLQGSKLPNIRRSPHSALPQRPQARCRRSPQSAAQCSLEHRPTQPTLAARRLPLTGVTARRRYIPESRPFETIVVPKLQKAATSTLPGSSRQQCSLQWVSSQFYFFFFFSK
nr:hypothetical protein Iba_chr03aCG1670 [Ipomoea batatas]